MLSTKRKLVSAVIIVAVVVIGFSYAVTHNGNSKTIRVNVVDYSRPEEWINIDQVSDTIANILINQRDDLIDVFSHFANNNDQEGNLILDSQGRLVNESNLALGGKEDVITKLLSETPPELDSEIFILENSVVLYLKGWGKDGTAPYVFRIVYNLQIDPTDEYIRQQSRIGSRIAPHWYVTLDTIAM
jgi:hypothetical protein